MGGGHDLAPGTELAADDLVAVDVRLDEAADAYLSAGTRPEGGVLARAVREGELLPFSALEEPAEHVQLALPVQAGYVPPGLGRGQLIDVYAVADPAAGAVGVADGSVTLVVRRATVQASWAGPTACSPRRPRPCRWSSPCPRTGAADVLTSIAGRPLVVVVHDSVDAGPEDGSPRCRGPPRAPASGARGPDRLMALQVFTAVTGAAWESELVGALDRADHGVTVVRRCVDVSELLAAAATGTGQAALLSAELRRLDGDAIARLDAAGVAVVGLVEPGDERAAERLRQLGVRHVLPADADPETIAQALREAVEGAAPSGRDVADPRAALPALGLPEAPEDRPTGPGSVVAVWGPTGAPGRTTVAVGIADEAARLGISTLLVDADVYGGVIAQVLGLLDESPGLAGAARLAGSGSLDSAAVVRLAWAVRRTCGS